MREVQILIRDDFDGTPDAATVTFAFQGTHYEIDLGPDNLVQFEEALTPYIKAARPTKIAGPKNKPSGGRKQTSSDVARAKIANGEPIPKYLQRTAELIRVRDWAEDNGWTLKTRARVPKDAHEAYNHAHPDQPVYQK